MTKGRNTMDWGEETSIIMTKEITPSKTFIPCKITHIHRLYTSKSEVYYVQLSLFSSNQVALTAAGMERIYFNFTN